MVVQYDAVCDGCGQQCEVPFNPRPGKPVYCTACYGRQRAPAVIAPRRAPRAAVAPRPRPAVNLDNASEADMAMVFAVLEAVHTWRAATAPQHGD